MTRHRRRNKLPKPSLQLRLTATFMGTLLLSIMLQLMLTRTKLLELALELPHDGPLLLQEVNSAQLGILLGSCGLLLPVCFLVGVLATFRLAGPIYRFEDHLRRLARGEDPGPCKIRDGDQLQDFCVLLNEAVAALRQRGQQPPRADVPDRLPEPPAALPGPSPSEAATIGGER